MGGAIVARGRETIVVFIVCAHMATQASRDFFANR